MLTGLMLWSSLAFPTTGGGDVLVPRGAVWSYLDDGSDQGTAWRAPSFDDSSWASGPAQLGYGDGDEATVVSYGSSAFNKHITTYFRHTFVAPGPSAYATLNLRLLRDDGAVVYLNGAEVIRSNMPPGGIDYLTLAQSTIDGASENDFAWIKLAPSKLLTGRNTLAVEIHQRSGSSSDISFDMELLGGTHEFVTRGPYLQIGTPTSINVRWHTDSHTDSKVWYGLSPSNLDQSVADTDKNKQHELVISGLQPATRYYYAVGKSTEVLAGGDSEHTFVTAPIPGTEKPTRVWAIGDCGTANVDAMSVRDAYYAFAGTDSTDVFLALGDNAYNDGTQTDYQAAIFDMYPDLLRKTALWPARGNHEREENVYYGIFSMPAKGEAGGVPSGTEAYYSYDHANAHFMVLDSEGSDRTVGGAMWTWLQTDLAATDQEWLLAYWHHPPYTKGSHDSDAEGRLIEMRQNFVPLLESGGVDLVLTGHSHSYERSFLIDGHYGDSSTFSEANKKNGGDGREGGDGVYSKPPVPNAGAVYSVAGSSGKTSSGSLDHPAMFYSIKALGSVILDINGERMDVTFLDSTGKVADFYTMAHSPWLDHGNALAGSNGEPHLEGAGTLDPGDQITLTLSSAMPLAPATLIIGLDELSVPFRGGTLVPTPDAFLVLAVDGSGDLRLSAPWPAGIPAGTPFYYQYWILDPAGPAGLSASNGISGTTPY